MSEHLLPTALPATDVRGGFVTLLYKETLRFWKVSMQTVFAPVVTTVLYLMIFAHVLANHVEVFPGVAYSSFLVPGLAMMAALQNAFANTSSSMIQSKMTGNLVFILLPPLSPAEIVGAYVLASMLRGFLCGAAVLLVGAWFAPAVALTERPTGGVARHTRPTRPADAAPPISSSDAAASARPGRGTAARACERMCPPSSPAVAAS